MEQAEVRDTDPDTYEGLDRRYRRAFTASLLVIVAVVVVALAYASFRDPGPQPTVPPKISGTDDGAIKRAIVHYVGALEQRDESELATIMGDGKVTVEGGTPVASEVIATYGDAAQQKATVDVSGTDSATTRNATVTYAGGTTQSVLITRVDGRWYVTPEPAGSTGSSTPRATPAG